MKIEITDNFKDIAKRISKVIDQVDNMKEYYDYFGTLMIASVDKNFDVEGRYKSKGSVYGGSKKWKKISKAWRDAKVNRSPSWSPKILQASGKMKQSMTYEARPDRCIFGTNLTNDGFSYPAFHNETRPFLVIQDEDINAWLEYVLSDIESML
jgi:phage gpG-like protein